MKFLAVALDYDGTIATNNVLNAEVWAAITELRSHDILVVIVTGRILAELQQVAGDLHIVDAVVAENGASIYFPGNGYIPSCWPVRHPTISFRQYDWKESNARRAKAW